MSPEHEQFISKTRHWVDTVVVGLNLCPFARRELVNNRLHFAVSDAVTQEQLLMDLHQTLIEMSSTDTIETTLLIHPDVLEDFDDYNQFLDYADALISDMQLEGIFQIASFHPHYQFAGTQPRDARNYSNKSPFPMLHILREASVEKAIAGYPDADLIPEHNQALLDSLGTAHLQHLLDGYKKP